MKYNKGILNDIQGPLPSSQETLNLLCLFQSFGFLLEMYLCAPLRFLVYKSKLEPLKTTFYLFN
jgi:hypothetical protein